MRVSLKLLVAKKNVCFRKLNFRFYLFQVITLVMYMTLRNRHGSHTMIWRSLKSKSPLCRVTEIGAATSSSTCTSKKPTHQVVTTS